MPPSNYIAEWVEKARSPSPSPEEIRPITHKLYEKPETQTGGDSQVENDAEGEPSVLWTAEIYSSETKRFRGREGPRVIYQSDKPLQIAQVEIAPKGIRELTKSDESIDNLVLGETEMKTIKGLSRRQNSKRDVWAADFIEGKGTGQIILLHGPPGVGKTYTVEAVAQYLHRPLLALTIADIGTVETRVEQELIRWFTLAEAWDSVLLVDEADIFLERRQNRDLARNGLVSAFLRRMEYFKGLLFLTTNRVGQIDDAFISRVHVAIGYGALNPESRSKIWQGFFRKLAKERAGKIQISPAAKKWVLEKAISGEAQLNGRDIRNALQTAITLAEAECEEDPDFDTETMTIIVDQSHFQRVMDITNKFQSYVQSIRREDEKKRAAGRYDRNDYWKGEVRGDGGGRSEF
ncbi:P-loop containing nucleoside triphosphate hydrolase protein [Apiospora rasikravindrae]|uniref:P-loop containing nucleoside triphosphate hydrolase protein n=1 Tax=Apiospora rasikravindrae TaxID=990691 RepID=A0ABR1RRX1_9PEZI